MAQTEKGIVYPFNYNEVADVPADFKALAESIDALLDDYSLNTDSGNKIVLEMNSTTYKIKAVLKDKDNNVINTSNEIDLPLENMVTNISYNNQTLILTHQDGQTTEVSIADLISNLASKEEVSELQSQVDDLTTLVETELDTNTVEGTEIDVSDSAEYRGKIEVKGNTEQEQLSGKNLWGGFSYTKSSYGVTFTQNRDGSISANGTATNTSSSISIANAVSQGIIKTLNAGTYTITGAKGTTKKLAIYDENANLLGEEKGSGLQLTLSQTTTIIIRLNISSGETCNNEEFYTQLEEGQTATEWEPYCGGQASPNPDYPQEIKVVTGDNVVKHVSKNQFDKATDIILKQTYTANGGTTQLDNSFIQTKYIRVKPNTSYILHTDTDITQIADNRLVICEYDSNYNFIRRNLASNVNTYTKVMGSNTQYVRICATTESIDTLQLEEGTTTPYEPYREESFEVNLGKNLFDKENANIINAGLSSKVISTSEYNRVLYIPVKSSTTYTIQRRNDGDVNRFRVGSCTVIPANNVSVPNSIENDNATNITITTGVNDKYLAVMYYRTYETVLTEQQILDSIQIEEGSTATSYSKYFTPIELCKIGDYQDILFKNVVGDENYNADLENDTYYKLKKAGKYVFDGTENISLQNNGNRIYIGYANNSNKFDKPIKPSSSTDLSHRILCSKLKQNTASDTWAGRQGVAYDYNAQSGYEGFDISISQISSLNEYRQAINGIEIYYELAEPKYEQITDPTLISQLEALKKAKWFKGVNHWFTETENLEPNLKGTYKQSNNLRIKEQDERLDNLESRLALLE